MSFYEFCFIFAPNSARRDSFTKFAHAKTSQTMFVSPLLRKRPQKRLNLLCPKPCFRRRNWFTNEDGVRVPKEALSEERLTFLCRRLDVDEPNCDALISYEEAITYVHPRPSQTVRGLHKVPKRRTLVQDSGKFAYHFSYILVVTQVIRFNSKRVTWSKILHLIFVFPQKDFKMKLMEW